MNDRSLLTASLGPQMLHRAVIKETPDERVVITVRKSSRIVKHLK
jgi:hypothetical protein